MLNDSTIPLIRKAINHNNQLAIIDDQGKYTYSELLIAAKKVASCLLKGKHDLHEARVAFIVPSSFDYVAVHWGIWLAGGIAVPLCISHPLPEIKYVLEDSASNMIVVHPDFKNNLLSLADERNLRVVKTSDAIDFKAGPLPKVEVERRAMILYTSGTTSRPKGVVTTHRNINAQIVSLIEAWGWTENDRILHVLPLHHTHGIVNVLLCALWAGATCEMLPKFNAEIVWDRFVQNDLTLFMAVPTTYNKLIAAWESAPNETQKIMSKACAKMRLMVSGSAALPVKVFKKWHEISGHRLLERYGMTEIGMALSNPLHGERRPGSVGQPLPGVNVKLINERNHAIQEEGVPGEIQVKGSNVFKEYWSRPDATQEAFCNDWFKTGDVAILENGYYRILGRSSVDIIKTGGYKVSALEIEEVLMSHPSIQECAVVGKEDEEWGECVCAALVLKNGDSLTLSDLRDWAKERMANYKIPNRILCLNDLPRNAMGKVIKPDLKKMFESGK